MRVLKKGLTLGLCMLFGITISSCSNKKMQVKNCEIIHELEFGGIYIKTTIEDFNKLGFEYGDSVDIKFSSGYEMKDQPYYNGYYVDAGESLLVGYPGYDYIKATLNYGDDLWYIAKFKDGDTGTVTVKLNKKKKYLDIQNTMDITYIDDRDKYEGTDAEFVNFRDVSSNVSVIKPNMIYRSASPCDGKHNRPKYVDRLIDSANIQYIMNLADTVEKIESYITKYNLETIAPYFLSLYRNNKFFFTSTNNEKIVPLAMNMNYKSKEFQQKLAQGFNAMAVSDGPYLIHCLEGKDRTGFVCIVVEALCGATYQQMVNDYMETYKNYYGITLEKDPLRYRIIKERNIDAMLRFLSGDDNVDLENTNFSNSIKNYLIEGGMTEANVNSFINKIKATN